MQILLCNANIQFFQFEAIEAEGAVSFKNIIFFFETATYYIKINTGL